MSLSGFESAYLTASLECVALPSRVVGSGEHHIVDCELLRLPPLCTTHVAEIFARHRDPASQKVLIHLEANPSLKSPEKEGHEGKGGGGIRQLAIYFGELE